jgi:hypothetical protein
VSAGEGINTFFLALRRAHRQKPFL